MRRRARGATLAVTLLAAVVPMVAHARVDEHAHAHKSASHDRGVPILMYHIVSNPRAGAPYPELDVRPRDFTAQMQWLGRHRFHAITLVRAYDYWRHGAALPKHPIVISFDDGYLSQYTHAFPILARHHWPAVLNMEVNFLRPDGGLRPWRVRKLLAAGWELDAHTLTHPDLTTVGAAELRRQVAGSRTALRRLFHVPVDFFCYPAGRYDWNVVAEVRRAGFLAATTTTYGLARPPDFYKLDRIPVDGSDGLLGFASKLTALTGR
jgi:peptidoglycan/xylan/chitin deacetylase (PgdA/CDA1 family)